MKKDEKPTPTYQDDCMKLLRILADAPTGGFSMYEIQDKAQDAGLSWSLVKINELLCSIRQQIVFAKIRTKGNTKAIRYELKSNLNR